MRHFPEGFYAALGLQLAAFWDVLGPDVRLFANTRLDPSFFLARGQWADRALPFVAAPRAIFFHWDEPPLSH
jgi:hypothetical protein